MTETASDRKLRTIERLEAGATPTELAFLREQREQIERRKARGPSSTDDSPPPDVLAKHVDRGFATLHAYQFERSKPDLDDYWRAWIDERIEVTRRALEPLVQQLQDAGFEYTPPLYEEAKLRVEAEVEELRCRLHELQTTAKLQRAWAERYAQVEALEPQLSQVDEQIAELERQLDAKKRPNGS